MPSFFKKQTMQLRFIHHKFPSKKRNQSIYNKFFNALIYFLFIIFKSLFSKNKNVLIWNNFVFIPILVMYGVVLLGGKKDKTVQSSQTKQICFFLVNYFNINVNNTNNKQSRSILLCVELQHWCKSVFLSLSEIDKNENKVLSRSRVRMGSFPRVQKKWRKTLK